MTTDIDRAPARLSGGLAVVAAGLAVGASMSGAAVPFGLAGVLLVGIGVLRGVRSAVTIGAWLAFAGVVVAGTAGAGPEALLVGTAAAVLSWDIGEHAVNVGEQLGRAADTRRGELVHAASSTTVAVGGIGIGYGMFLVAAGGQPVTALVLLLGAALLLAAALRD